MNISGEMEISFAVAKVLVTRILIGKLSLSLFPR
jgi:hypothetical protein